MRKTSKSTLLTIGVIWVLFSPCGFAQETGVGTGEILPPPVNIEFNLGSAPQVGEEVELKIRVTPQEDMHADISCLLPGGIEPIREKGVIVRPYEDWYYYSEGRQAEYREVVELWVGPLKGGITKEFTFRVIIPDKKRYEFIARVEALAEWGIKEKIFVIEIT